VNWGDLLAAIALVLVLEGILPFINPRRVRDTLERISSMSDNALRWTGLISMVAGALLLAFVR
jgi:uncharacterized protein